MASTGSDPAVRRLVVLRHAKSAYPPGVPDAQRPLSERGRTDAPRAGRWLAAHVGVVDLVVCSPAARTQDTWALAGAALGPVPVVVDPRVYGAAVDDLLAVLAEVDPAVGTLVLVGHSPGLPDLVVELVGPGPYPDPQEQARVASVAGKFPTCAVAVLHTGHPWSGLPAGGARLVALTSPRHPGPDWV
ncbi:MAG: SixA phosphatase family protein [Actinomycetes bacterium]